jgi:3-dehydroquinate synthase
MPQVTRIRINLPAHSYDATISSGLLLKAGEHLRGLIGSDKRLFAVTVPPVRRKWGKKLMDSLRAAGFVAQMIEIPDGERHKKLSTVELLAEKLTRLGAERNAVIIALGGGVVGDVAGMLASVYMRGVSVVQIPTTVLAQVDASIGGKTGVNLRTGKNLLGTFHQPLAVLIDPTILATLPEREFRAGLYESLKAGVIGNPELFRRMEKIEIRLLRQSASELEWIIAASVKLKAEVVSADEREGGLRRVLNFGHTIGHALEAESNYRRFLHGEAVAWGMIAATCIAIATKRLDQQIGNRIVESVLALGPLPKVTASSRKILKLLQTDKKTSNRVVHFVLPTEIGRVAIVNDVPESIIVEAVNRLRKLSSSA